MKRFGSLYTAWGATCLAFLISRTRAKGTCTSICGEGNKIMYPDALMTITDIFGQVHEKGCQASQDLITRGFAPEGYCSVLSQYAVVPCGCTLPDGTLLADTVHAPTMSPASLPADAGAPSTTALKKCPDREETLLTCLETVENGDACASCVTSYWPDLPTNCAGIDDETCMGLLNCPCGKCVTKFVKYIKCLAPSCKFSCQSSSVTTPIISEVPASMGPTEAPIKKKKESENASTETLIPSAAASRALGWTKFIVADCAVIATMVFLLSMGFG